MWAGTIAHNNLLNTGRVGDWGSHDIEHEISGIYDVAHGAGLAVVFPAWMKYVVDHDVNRFVQWAVRVWNVELNVFDPRAVALDGVARMEAFFRSLGAGTTLAELGVKDDRIDEMADKCTNGGKRTVGNFVKLDRDAVGEDSSPRAIVRDAAAIEPSRAPRLANRRTLAPTPAASPSPDRSARRSRDARLARSRGSRRTKNRRRLSSRTRRTRRCRRGRPRRRASRSLAAIKARAAPRPRQAGSTARRPR